MSMIVKDVIEWLSTFEPDDEVGVDEGGLTLRVVGYHDAAYLEIGGLPEEEDEDA